MKTNNFSICSALGQQMLGVSFGYRRFAIHTLASDSFLVWGTWQKKANGGQTEKARFKSRAFFDFLSCKKE